MRRITAELAGTLVTIALVFGFAALVICNSPGGTWAEAGVLIYFASKACKRLGKK